MTNLNDFLKCEKVRCLSNNYNCVEQMKAYRLLGIRVQIVDDSGDVGSYSIDDFQPVIETAIQANTQDKPKFESGNLVYSVDKKIHEIDRIQEGVASFIGGGACKLELCCHAIPENYALLSQLYPHIEFEAPPKELTGSDLCRAMLDKGWKYVVCEVGNHVGVYSHYDESGHIFEVGGCGSFDVIPIDPKTGEILTSEVLDG